MFDLGYVWIYNCNLVKHLLKSVYHISGYELVNFFIM